MILTSGDIALAMVSATLIGYGGYKTYMFMSDKYCKIMELYTRIDKIVKRAEDEADKIDNMNAKFKMYNTSTEDGEVAIIDNMNDKFFFNQYTSPLQDIPPTFKLDDKNVGLNTIVKTVTLYYDESDQQTPMLMVHWHQFRDFVLSRHNDLIDKYHVDIIVGIPIEKSNVFGSLKIIYPTIQINDQQYHGMKSFTEILKLVIPNFDHNEFFTYCFHKKIKQEKQNKPYNKMNNYNPKYNHFVDVDDCIYANKNNKNIYTNCPGMPFDVPCMPKMNANYAPWLPTLDHDKVWKTNKSNIDPQVKAKIDEYFDELDNDDDTIIKKHIVNHHIGEIDDEQSMTLDV